MKKIKKKKAIITYIINSILIITLIVGNYFATIYSDIISVYFNQKTYSTTGEDGSDYYTSDFASNEELVKYEEEVCKDVEAEGIVLLKNENNALPLSNSETKISVFGQDSVDLVYGGAGSGSVDTTKAPTLKDAFTTAGFSINDTLWDFYASGDGSSYRKKVPDAAGKGQFAVNEAPWSKVSDSTGSSFAQYGDAAVIVIGRSGGESKDIPTGAIDTSTDGTKYLELDKNERDMIEAVCNNDSFKKVIVIINSSNALELGFLEEYEIDACLWVGAVGQTGAYAIGEVLSGTVNPSGHLVDTYAYDSTSAPSYQNFGDYTIVNSYVTDTEGTENDKYIVYSEGIYIGYRYYETRYEDAILSQGNAGAFDYATTVQFPFGYGLSYTSFTWSDYSINELDANNYEVSVTVTNTGMTAGKDAVEVYMQSPYTDYDKLNGIEKPSVELVGFAKTSELAAGAAETVTIEVAKENMKAYDSLTAKTYIVDTGDYYFTAAEDAHVAINNILASKGKTTETGLTAEGKPDFVEVVNVSTIDTTLYQNSLATGYAITNQFDSADVRSFDPSFVYLTRNDWESTYPTIYADGKLTASDQMISDLAIKNIDNPDAKMPVFDTIDPEYGSLTAVMLRDVGYNDPKWGALLNQLTMKEMTNLVSNGGYITKSIDSISLPGTMDKDGPAGISSTLTGGVGCMAYPAEVVMAATWNVELINTVGKCIGEDSLSSGVQGWYAPGINTHRSPYSGRNFEYYSEDSYLAGMMSANEVQGVRSKGVIAFMKHFALNDQETNRIGACIFANEQTIREIYLKPFEYAVRFGGSIGAMASMNRIGTTWSGGHYGLMTEVLRNEWSFQGMVVTDQASFDTFMYEDLVEGVSAGTDLWLNTNKTLWVLNDQQLANPTIMTNVRNAAHNIIYAVVNSNAMNGVGVETQVTVKKPLWQIWLMVVSIIVFSIALISIILTTIRLLKGKEKSKKKEANI